MVTMNSEKSACRRKPIEKSSSSSSSSKKAPEHVDDVDKRNEEDRANDSPDLSPNTPTYNVTASCAEDTPNYLVYKKVFVANKIEGFKILVKSDLKKYLVRFSAIKINFNCFFLIYWTFKSNNIAYVSFKASSFHIKWCHHVTF